MTQLERSILEIKLEALRAAECGPGEDDDMTFQQFCREHRVTPAEREVLAVHLATLRATATIKRGALMARVHSANHPGVILEVPGTCADCAALHKGLEAERADKLFAMKQRDEARALLNKIATHLSSDDEGTERGAWVREARALLRRLE